MGKQKTQGVAQFAGSLKTHWLMYINHVELKMNPRCPKGIGMNTRLIRLMGGLDSKFIQPGFKFQTDFYKPKSYYDPSILHFKFVNGYEKQYYPAMVTWNEMLADIKEINRLIEFERNYTG